MEALDLVIAPFYFILLYLGVYRYSQSKYSNLVIRKNFRLAFVLKCFGAISLGIIYKFYYDGGDTYNYYSNSNHIFKAWIEDPIIALKLIFTPYGDGYGVDGGRYSQYMYFFNDRGSYFVVRVMGFLSLFTFNNYSAMALIFALISFSGVWMIYKAFCQEFPAYHKYLAYTILFLPSLVFWGSGLMKDSICLGAIGWLVYGCYNFFSRKRFSLKYGVLILLGSFTLLNVKSYIFFCALPAIFTWVSISYSARVKDKIVRLALAPVLIVIILIPGLFLTKSLSESSEKYSVENVIETSAVTAHYLKRISKEGAAYELSGNFDGSPSNFVKLAPEAILVSWFRPFLWEARNPVMLIAALENTAILLMFIYFLFNLFKTFKIKKSKTGFTMFAFLFSVLFGTAIGLTTYNFGALARYKIPLLPFLTSILLINSLQIIEKKDLKNVNING